MWIRSIERAYKLDCLFHSLPWNQDTILGYAGEMLVGLLYILVFWMIDFQIVILFIAICYHQFTFYEMFVNFVVHLKQSKKTYRKTNAILKIVKFHKDIKRYELHTMKWHVLCVRENFISFLNIQNILNYQWTPSINYFRFFYYSSDAYSFYFGGTIICITLGVACSVLIVEMVIKKNPSKNLGQIVKFGRVTTKIAWLKNPKFLARKFKTSNFVIGPIEKQMFFFQKIRNRDDDAFFIACGTISNIGIAYLQCLLGKMITERFARMPNHLFEHTNWYRLPNKLQKYFLLMIANTQKPLFFDGLGMFIVNLETFTTVRRKAARDES